MIIHALFKKDFKFQFLNGTCDNSTCSYIDLDTTLCLGRKCCTVIQLPSNKTNRTLSFSILSLIVTQKGA